MGGNEKTHAPQRALRERSVAGVGYNIQSDDQYGGFSEAGGASFETIANEQQAPYSFGPARSGGRFSKPLDYQLLADRYSSKNILWSRQTVLLTLSISFFFIFLALDSHALMFACSVVISLFYLAIISFRTAILAGIDKITMSNSLSPSPAQLSAIADKRYFVAAALYKEANQVADLVASLNKLNWPIDNRQIALVCEEDDVETIEAARKHITLLADFCLVIVPGGAPKTKPRALNYALGRAAGDYLVIYDAEDRPHPNQLIEAALKFENASDELVCLQAPLVIDNADENLLTHMFALEYDTLFSGIIPTLARWNAPIPLGGTSNHFRLPKLFELGGWDSYNVTEDADLGVRIARMGWRCGSIRAPTFEEAPSKFRPWLNQRTRWIKGWIMTILVHNRQPLATLNELGLLNFLLLHAVLTSLIISMLVHPLFWVNYLYHLYLVFSGFSLDTTDLIFIGVGSFNLIAGYLMYMLLSYAVQVRLYAYRNRALPKRWILVFPIYWMYISIAGLRACFQLIFQPHLWEKTPHGDNGRSKARR